MWNGVAETFNLLAFFSSALSCYHSLNIFLWHFLCLCFTFFCDARHASVFVLIAALCKERLPMWACPLRHLFTFDKWSLTLNKSDEILGELIQSHHSLSFKILSILYWEKITFSVTKARVKQLNLRSDDHLVLFVTILWVAIWFVGEITGNLQFSCPHLLRMNGGLILN